MARRQTRRSISVSKDLLARARAYADDNGVALAALTEYELEAAIGRPFDAAAFAAWDRTRRRRVLDQCRSAGIAAAGPPAP